jgi:hypothetical protein
MKSYGEWSNRKRIRRFERQRYIKKEQLDATTALLLVTLEYRGGWVTEMILHSEWTRK